ncbi:hypothetical protein B0H10DRAFT_2437682 [Mycena sp. CBHHK59/15]|nr:hypothetical protein B0H10DRAFT_2437682 [Mycena sp. CBHHK59/15]
MARVLVKAGCSQGNVGSVICYVAKSAGIVVKGNPSRRSVQRALMEGGLAAKIQLGYELAQADGITASGDATSLRGENYEVSCLMVNKDGTHKMRILSITSTVDHSSETQKQNWQTQITGVSEIFKKSPLGRRSALNFEVSDFLRLLKGMNGDHAADMKKTVRMMHEWKVESSRIMLGWDKIQKLEPAAILQMMCDIRAKNIEEAGGEEAWNRLSNEQKDVLSKSSMDALALRLGEEAFDELLPEEKHEINLFFWAGCSMHKELNSVKAFSEGMDEYYKENGLEGPVLLANKDNDATIQLSSDTGTSTAAVQRALKVSERGAVKLISLLGAFINHKDDKKGCHDVYENYFRPLIGDGVRFPDTSNTRYQCYGLGGARLISYLEEHKTFMLFIKDKKEKRTLNHLEQNILKGMNCPETIAQAVALVLYCMSVTHPYALRVRGAGTENLNILDLRPFHVTVKDHIHKLINAPNLLLSDAPQSYRLAMLDGQSWSDAKAFAACLKHAPTLPNVKPLLVAGLTKALACWERFTSEFEQGGTINLSTSAEKELAFMPSTNDANEGLLRMWCRFSQENPSSTVGHFQDRVMFHRNDTQTFIDSHLNTAADQQFLRQEVRMSDASGAEKQRQAELIAHSQRVVDDKRAKDALNARKAAAKKAHLLEVGMKLDRNEIMHMKNAELKDQLDIHRGRGDKEIPIKARMSKKAEWLAALLAALDRFEVHKPLSVEELNALVGHHSEIVARPRTISSLRCAAVALAPAKPTPSSYNPAFPHAVTRLPPDVLVKADKQPDVSPTKVQNLLIGLVSTEPAPTKFVPYSDQRTLPRVPTPPGPKVKTRGTASQHPAVLPAGESAAAAVPPNESCRELPKDPYNTMQRSFSPSDKGQLPFVDIKHVMMCKELGFSFESDAAGSRCRFVPPPGSDARVPYAARGQGDAGP